MKLKENRNYHWFIAACTLLSLGIIFMVFSLDTQISSAVESFCLGVGVLLSFATVFFIIGFDCGHGGRLS